MVVVKDVILKPTLVIFVVFLQDDYVGSCNHMQRKDEKDVCFKLVEE